MSGGNIKVVVRCRPLNSREIARGAKCLIRMEGNQTIITRPDGTDPANAKKRDADPLMSECLVYQIKNGITRVGKSEAEAPADIRLSGENIMDEHCYFENKDGSVTLHPCTDSLTMVNGICITAPEKLSSGFRIILGDFHVFRFNNPEEVRKERAKSKQLSISIANNEDGLSRPDSSTSLMSEAVIDWNYAKREVALNYLNSGGDNSKSTTLPDEDLQKLMENIKKKQKSHKRLYSRNEHFDDDTEPRTSEKMRKTEEIQREREKTLEELGIMVEKNAVGVHLPKKIPHLVNLNEDPLMSECLVYQIKNGITRVGKSEAEAPADIRLSGENIMDEHCYFENKDGVVTLHPCTDSLTMVNGMRITAPEKLSSGFRIILGDFHVFRFNNPEEVRKERAKSKQLSISIVNNEDGSKPPDSSTTTASLMSEVVKGWNYAKREAALNYLNDNPTFMALSDEDLQKMMEDIKKIQEDRKKIRQ
ncbi:4268_t:CDS:2 [Entrophospora sp. SA101]|nr:4268_t:CDS:2 [Entrophospora sp. SA101]